MIFFGLCLILTLILYWKFHEIQSSVAHLPGPRPLPFIGNALISFGKKNSDILSIAMNLAKKYGLFVRFLLGPNVKHLIFDPKDVEALLVDQRIMDKTEEYDILSDWCGKGLLTASPEKWHAQRKIANQGFQFRCLQEFVKIFEKNSEVLVTKLNELAGKTVDIFPIMIFCTLDNICETTMGTSINAQLKSESSYAKAVDDISDIFAKRFFNILLRFNFIFKLSGLYKKQEKILKILNDFTNEVIVTRRAQLEKKIKEGKVVESTALIDVFLTSTLDGNSLTNDQIREEVSTFMAAGYDTTASAIAFCLFSLAKHPEIQQKAFEEVQSSLGDVEGETTMANLNKLCYLDLVIKETLRLYPPVALIGRNFLENTTLNGKFIPKGTAAIIFSIVMGRSEKIWENAESFIPERFEPENLEGKNSFSYLPFGAGPRVCIGQKFAILEIKSVVAKVLKNFELFADGFEPIVSLEVVTKSSNGMKLRIERRQ